MKVDLGRKELKRLNIVLAKYTQVTTIKVSIIEDTKICWVAIDLHDSKDRYVLSFKLYNTVEHNQINDLYLLQRECVKYLKKYNLANITITPGHQYIQEEATC